MMPTRSWLGGQSAEAPVVPGTYPTFSESGVHPQRGCRGDLPGRSTAREAESSHPGESPAPAPLSQRGAYTLSTGAGRGREARFAHAC
eukprot:1764605-Pleurochrysis_carterae.AAC.3